MRTTIDIPDQFLLRYVNSNGQEREIIVLGTTFVCKRCGYVQSVEHSSTQLTIGEFHSPGCVWYG